LCNKSVKKRVVSKGTHSFYTFIAQSRPPDPPPDTIFAQFECLFALYLGMDCYNPKSLSNACAVMELPVPPKPEIVDGD
jgi:hypothetical protein